MEFNITGTIHNIEIEQQITDSFRKREFVVKIDADTDYPQLIKLELIQDNCSKLDNYKIGDEIEAGVNLKGREWNPPDKDGKKQSPQYFNTLQSWWIKSVKSDAPETTEVTSESEIFAGESPDGDDDLIF